MNGKKMGKNKFAGFCLCVLPFILGCASNGNKIASAEKIDYSLEDVRNAEIERVMQIADEKPVLRQRS